MCSGDWQPPGGMGGARTMAWLYSLYMTTVGDRPALAAARDNNVAPVAITSIAARRELVMAVNFAALSAAVGPSILYLSLPAVMSQEFVTF